MAENKSQQKEVLNWIQEVLEEPLPSEDFAEVLKDGVILCRLMNKIVPGAIKKFKQKGPAFLLMENIQARSHLRLDFGFQKYIFFSFESGFEQMTILNL